MNKYDYNVAVAVDFDGTITKEDRFPSPEYEYSDQAIHWLKLIKKIPNVVLILWTCAMPARIKKVTEEMEERFGLVFDYINEYPARQVGTARKINADDYIDDRNNNGVIDWMGTYSRIERISWKREAMKN